MPTIYSLLSCLFVFAYSAIRKEVFRYHPIRQHLIGWCILMTDYGALVFVVPLAGLLLTVWLARKGRLQALSLLSAALCIFAILWVFICLLVWELNEIPHVSLRGLS